MAVRFEMKGYKDLQSEIEKLKKAPRTVLERTEKDIKERGPGWIAQGVVERYNIEGSKGKGKKAITSGKIGKLKIKGSLNGDMQLEYSGRLLTPVHFGMKPTTMPDPGSQYTLKWKVLNEGGDPMVMRIKKLTKKQRKNIAKNLTQQGTRTSMKSPWMLQHTGNTKEGGTNYIPFQRTEKTDRKMSVVARTISLPQMVTQGKDGPLQPKAAEIFNENLEKRLDHHMKLLSK